MSSAGNLQVILSAQNGAPYVFWQDQATGEWQNGGPLPTSCGRVVYSAMSPGHQGNLQLVLLGKDGLPYLSKQDAVAGTWTDAGKLPNPGGSLGWGQGALATGVGSQGNLQAICLGPPEGTPYLIYQDASSAA